MGGRPAVRHRGHHRAGPRHRPRARGVARGHQAHPCGRRRRRDPRDRERAPGRAARGGRRHPPGARRHPARHRERFRQAGRRLQAAPACRGASDDARERDAVRRRQMRFGAFRQHHGRGVRRRDGAAREPDQAAARARGVPRGDLPHVPLVQGPPSRGVEPGAPGERAHDDARGLHRGIRRRLVLPRPQGRSDRWPARRVLDPEGGPDDLPQVRAEGHEGHPHLAR